jgi:hypothetical protein
MPATNNTADPLAAYHHPNYVSMTVQEHPYGHASATCRVEYRPFAGTEAEPRVPAAAHEDKALPYDQYQTLCREYDALRDVWAQARFTTWARTELAAAAPVWKAYSLARKGMDAQFDAFRDLEDGKWNAGALALNDAHSAALAAARKWDAAAERLASLHTELHTVLSEDQLTTPTLDSVAASLGLDIGAWCIDLDRYAYRDRHGYPEHWTPLVTAVSEAIDDQRKRVQEAAALVGRHGS